MHWHTLVDSLTRRYEHLRVTGLEHAQMVLKFGGTRIGIHIEPAEHEHAVVISAEIGPIGVVDATDALAMNRALITSAIAIRDEALVVRAAISWTASESQFDARLQSAARLAAELKHGNVPAPADGALFSYLAD